MKTIAAALAEMMPHFEPLGAERRQLLAAQGAVLAEDVIAGIDLPGFDNSAMDGYAVRHADATEAGATGLPVAGESRAGGPPPGPLSPATAMRIFTGAPMPDGADTVVMVEQTELVAGRLRIARLPDAGSFIRRRGDDLGAGAVALALGSRIGSGEIGLLAGLGVGAVSVYRRPRVAILATGDELRDIGQTREPGTIVNSNTYALAAMVREAGAEPQVLPTANDDLEVIKASLRQALTAADLVLTTGGVSVGAYDLVAEAYAQVGVVSHFWKVAIKPGKPLRFGSCGGVPVVGLPGNPVSAMVTFEVFVRPGIRRMLGDLRPYRQPVTVELTQALFHDPGRLELVRARLRHEAGRLLAEPHPRQGSGSLPSMSGVDALVMVPTDCTRVAAGEKLSALLLSEAAAGSRATPPFA
ncbi:MAG: molybdopterin molybdotransferase MoeA [Myxococcales bacterium]|nr:molybdopterin molybdotransferase MoeA [Myxococcales bacterium]